MFVLSAGIPKSGSTLLMVYARDLLSMEYGNIGQMSFQNWVKNGPVGGIEAYPWENWVDYFQEINQIANCDGPFVLKTHKSFLELEEIIRTKNVKTIYSIRDPRDIVLSAIDHGIRSRANQETVFADCYDLESTISHVSDWCEQAIQWIKAEKVEIFRYEELVQNSVIQAIRLANYLGVSKSSNSALQVVKNERTSRQPTKNQFNKGKIHRFSVEMSDEEIQKTEMKLKKYIQSFGYPLY